MSSVAIFASIIGVVVVMFVAVAYISLTLFFFEAQKKLVENSLEDDEVKGSVRRELSKHKEGRCKSRYLAWKHLSQKNKDCEIMSALAGTLICVVCVLIGAFVGFSNAVDGDDGHIWIGDTAGVTIKTQSMQTANITNAYLKDENGKLNDDDRIPQYSFITISKKQKYIDEIGLYDVVAFKMPSDDGKSEITVIHRLINIEYDESGNPLYTFRGDANPSSMAGELKIGRDRIVGVFKTQNYNGAKCVVFGWFVSYLQSSFGIMMLTIAVMLMIICGTLLDRLGTVYKDRRKELTCGILHEEVPFLYNDWSNLLGEGTATDKTEEDESCEEDEFSE